MDDIQKAVQSLRFEAQDGVGFDEEKKYTGRLTWTPLFSHWSIREIGSGEEAWGAVEVPTDPKGVLSGVEVRD